MKQSYPSQDAPDVAGSEGAAHRGFETPTRVERLGNGLRVIVAEDHRAPVVVHTLWFAVGSIDESSGTTGLAHALEHMMFNGSAAHGFGEYDKQMSAIGAYANAHTWVDFTAYTVEAPSARLERVMALEAERLGHLVIDEAQFSREMRVIMEERRQFSDDDPTGLLYEQLFASAFQASPQRWPIIGWMSDLESLRVEDVRHWYRQWYVPNNAVLVLAGDVEPHAAIALAEQHYGALAARELPPRRPQREPAQRGTRRISMPAAVPQPQLAIGFKAPALREIAGDDDVFALWMLAELLDGQRLLDQALVRRRRIADETWAWYEPLSREPGLFVVGALAARGKSASAVEAALLAVLAEVAREGVPEAELRRAKIQLQATRVFRRDSIADEADEIGRLAMLGFDVADAARIDERLAGLSVEHIRSVAARYFDPGNMTVALLEPERSAASTQARRQPAQEEVL